jgi:hypothetical protein
MADRPRTFAELVAATNPAERVSGALRDAAVLIHKMPRFWAASRYHVHRLIEKYGRMGNMMKWREMLNADCPKRDASQLHDRCNLVCPDLPKVV